MDAYDYTQLAIVGTMAVIFGRIGLAFARAIERKLAGQPAPSLDTEDRLRIVEDECLSLRREVAELQERQDFAERALLHDPARGRSAGESPAERVVTPH